jgi:hypothetical protein
MVTIEELAELNVEQRQARKLAMYREAAEFLEKNKDTILMPQKFMADLKLILIKDLKKLHQDHPEMPLLKVIFTVLTGVNDKISAKMILEIVPFIIEEWQSLEQKIVAQITNSELELA